MSEVRTAQPQAERPEAMSATQVPKELRRGDVGVDDGDELEVGGAERHDPVGRAPQRVAPAGEGDEPVLVEQRRPRRRRGRRTPSTRWSSASCSGVTGPLLADSQRATEQVPGGSQPATEQVPAWRMGG